MNSPFASQRKYIRIHTICCPHDPGSQINAMENRTVPDLSHINQVYTYLWVFHSV